MTQPLTIRIPIRNKNGDVVGEKEVVSYAGLLATAHDEGLESIETELVQSPGAHNDQTAIVRAVVVGRRGTYTGLGDADPTNVNRSVARHLLRIAETRAKARALRDYVNVGMVSLEELGGDDDSTPDTADAPASRPASNDNSGATPGPMSDAQRRMLWRQALTLGYEGDAATTFLDERLGVRDGRLATRRDASRVIDELDAELRRRNSNQHGGGHRAA